jgi:hypothetical protein
MRNLKKILALVLALVMTMSVMSVASAAKAGTDYSDDASITQFDESIQVLTQLGIYRGDEDGFRPNSTITRAEAAALVYRIISTDVNDKQTNIYSDYNKFSDVKSTDWFAGYVNYCANGQYIVGNGDGTFNYNGNITGYELLAIILRSLGYGQEGEYTGTGWEIKTATDARKLGITKNIVESTLGQAQTRAAVAEMLFQGLTCTQTVEHTTLLGYSSTNVITNTVHATLGYENFGLRGYIAAGDIADYVEDFDTDNTATITDGFYLKEMTSRKDAIADNSDDMDENTTVTRALYGEPVAFWYATSIANPKTNVNGEIVVRFNPVQSYSVAVDEATLFAASGLTGVSADINEGNANEDGVAEFTRDGDYDALYKSLADKRTVKEDSEATLDVYGGKGTSTELFVADGNVFVVVKNTYVDHVLTSYSATYNRVLELESQTEIDALTDAEWATLAGLAPNSVVLFNVYSEVADYTTIHTATSKTVTLTNSYVEENGETIDQCEESYFLVSKDKYEYDCKTLDSFLFEEHDENHLLLDRNLLLAEGKGCDTQVLYFDDYGYVIWSTDVPSSTTTGYMIVTSTAYGGYDKDNGYYMNITGYDKEGNSVTVKGAFGENKNGDPAYVYATKEEATDYAATIGIYYYTIDSDTGLYSLDEDPVEANEPDGNILAGDPDAVSSDDIADSDTVFVIANYNTKGAITGYTVKTGIKNIPDLKDADLENKNTVIYDTSIDWEVSYVGEGIVDLVLVLGSKQSTDVKYTAKDAAIDDVFYLLNTTPEKHFDLYNEYSVVMDGKVTVLDVDVNAEGEADGDYTALMDEVGFYKVTSWTNDYAYGIEAVDAAELGYVGSDVLSFDGDAETLWKYASCHEGLGEDNQGYIVLADSCKIYDVTNGKLTPIEVKDLMVDEDLDTPVNALGYESVKGVVADWNEYGFATIIYVVNNAD